MWRREVERRLAARQRRREAELRHRADQQRLRVAREVHDTVAHTLAVVGVQADVAAETLRLGDTDKAAQAIDVVRRTNKRALQELRATVALLRSDVPDPDQRQPVPRLTELPALIDHIKDSGLHVEVTDDGHTTATGRTGNGLRGMRERALAIGGQLQAGSRPRPTRRPGLRGQPRRTRLGSRPVCQSATPVIRNCI